MKKQPILFCGQGWAATHFWIPRLVRLGFQDFSFYDPAKAALPAVEGTHLLPSLESVDATTTALGIVASPNKYHQEHALALLQKGISIVIEKPVCMSVKGSQELEAAASKTGASILRSCPSLYDPHFQRFQDLLAALAPEMGRITSVKAHWLRARGIPASPWLTTAAHALAGSSLDLGWHIMEWVMAALHYPTMVMDSATFEGCASDTSMGYASWYGEGIPSAPVSMDVDTAATIFLKTESGIHVELRTAWDSNVVRDEVAIEAEGLNGSLSLRTILGMSTNGPALPRIEGQVGHRAIHEILSSKPPGTAHNKLVEQFVAGAFSPIALGQDWHQLHVMAAVAESITTGHAKWRDSFSTP